MLAQGFFPAGPMDHLALRAANLLAGNDESAAGLEVTLGNVALRLDGEATVAVCGAETERDGRRRSRPALGEPSACRRARSFASASPRARAFAMYVAFSGGVDVPPLFGSRATYTMGALGGLEGRALKAGRRPAARRRRRGKPVCGSRQSARPSYAREWEIEAMRGPQAAPDYLTEDDMQTFFGRAWAVDRNSNRTGIRLESHLFEWARSSGGVAGGHPSNILDNSYPVGAVNVNGDLPVILGPDGPTAGGFVCAATVIHAGFWKIGQLRPVGDTVRFREVTEEEAAELDRDLGERLSTASLEDA